MRTGPIATRKAPESDHLRLVPLVLAMMLGGCAVDEGPSDNVGAAGEGRHPSYARDAANESWPAIEDGTEPEVAPEAIGAVNYYVVLDGSGSMDNSTCSGSSTKIEAAVAALQRFVDAVPEDANLGLAAFDQAGTSERTHLATGNRDAFRSALNAVVAGGGTPLRSAIDLGFERLTAQARRQLGWRPPRAWRRAGHDPRWHRPRGRRPGTRTSSPSDGSFPSGLMGPSSGQGVNEV